jgi:hypothetical protein
MESEKAERLRTLQMVSYFTSSYVPATSSYHLMLIDLIDDRWTWAQPAETTSLLQMAEGLESPD